VQAWLISILSSFFKSFLMDLLTKAYDYLMGYLKKKKFEKEVDHAVSDFKKENQTVTSEAEQKQSFDHLIDSTYNKPK
jgi:hypothetical protein